MKSRLTSFGDRLSSSNCLPAQFQAQDLGLVVLADIEGSFDILDVRHDGVFILSRNVYASSLQLAVLGFLVFWWDELVEFIFI
jgi:hypothetical protein